MWCQLLRPAMWRHKQKVQPRFVPIPKLLSYNEIVAHDVAFIVQRKVQKNGQIFDNYLLDVSAPFNLLPIIIYDIW